MRVRSLGLAVAVATWHAAPAAAQLGEVRLGAVGSYVAADAYRGGAGITIGYAPGRLAWMGLRWIHHFGSTGQLTDSAGSATVTNRAQLFGADLGLEFPVGATELVVGGTLGAVHFSQRAEPAAPSAGGTSSDGATEFVAAPLAMLHVRAGRLMLVPQLTWYFAGSPDLRWPLDHAGPAASLAIVYPIETDRIRY